MEYLSRFQQKLLTFQGREQNPPPLDNGVNLPNESPESLQDEPVDLFEYRKRRLAEFYAAMSLHFRRPTECQGAKCSGLVYYWEGPMDLRRQNEPGCGWREMPCDCPAGAQRDPWDEEF
jgi:hypothetical protein